MYTIKEIHVMMSTEDGDKRWRRKPKPEKLGIVRREDPSQAPSPDPGLV